MGWSILLTVKRKVQKRIWEIVEVSRNGDKWSRNFDLVILSLIGINVVSSILHSVESIGPKHETVFHTIEVVSVIIFTIEYIARLISCTSDHRYSHTLWGRLQFMLTPMLLIDLLAILPFYISFFMVDLTAMRILRMIRIFRIAKMVRYSHSFQLIGTVFRKNREELVIIGIMMLFLVIMSSSLMFYAEHKAQPENFPDIPTTMWWAVITLTTVGYGDVTPLTTIGKIVAAVIAIAGIAMFALPAGILGAGFIRELNAKQTKGQIGIRCPHCGNELDKAFLEKLSNERIDDFTAQTSTISEIEKISETISLK